MSGPDDAAAGAFPDDDTASEKTTAKSFASQVNEAVSNMTQDDKGLWVVPEGLPEEVAYAATLEKRRRDTQSSYEKSKSKLTATESENLALREKLANDIRLDLTVEESEELEDLKANDPEAWRDKLNEYEDRAKAKRSEELEEVSSTASEQTEIVRREQLLKDFLDENPGLVLNDEVFENELPPRITKKLENGEVTFEEFLSEAKNYLSAGKVVGDANGKAEDEPNLGSVGGGDKASDDAVEKDILASYNDTIF